MEVEIMLDMPRSRGPAARPPASPTDAQGHAPDGPGGQYQGLVDVGELRDYADIARLGYVTRARITQIMNLSNLAPDIQEKLLFPDGFLPPERRLRKLAGQVDWDEQRRLWRELVPGLKDAASAVLSANPMQ